MAGIALGQSIFQMLWAVPDPKEAVGRWHRTARDGSSFMPSQLQRYPDRQFEVASSGLLGTAQFSCFARTSEE